MSSELRPLVYNLEKSRLEAIFSALKNPAALVGTDIKLNSKYLDRKDTDTTFIKNVAGINSVENIAFALHNYMDSERIQRDMKIIKAGHMQLIKGALKVAFRRTKELDRQLNGWYNRFK